MAQKVRVVGGMERASDTAGLAALGIIAAPFLIHSYFKQKKQEKEEEEYRQEMIELSKILKKCIFIYNIENINLDYIPMKYISHRGDFKEESEVKLISEVMSLGANAILNFEEGSKAKGTAVIIKNIDEVLEKYPQMRKASKFLEFQKYLEFIDLLSIKYTLADDYKIISNNGKDLILSKTKKFEEHKLLTYKIIEVEDFLKISFSGDHLTIYEKEYSKGVYEEIETFDILDENILNELKNKWRGVLTQKLETLNNKK